MYPRFARLSATSSFKAEAMALGDWPAADISKTRRTSAASVGSTTAGLEEGSSSYSSSVNRGGRSLPG